MKGIKMLLSQTDLESMAELRPDPRDIIRSRLRPNERLLWAGCPDPSIVFGPEDRFLVPFSLMWAGFAVFWEVSALSSLRGGSDWFFALWGIPFVAAGVYITFGRFIVKRRRKAKLAYGVTTQRAVVVVDAGREVTEAPIGTTSYSVRRSRDGQHGLVRFGTGGNQAAALFGNSGWPRWGMSGVDEVAFYDVADIAAAVNAIESARRPAA